MKKLVRFIVLTALLIFLTSWFVYNQRNKNEAVVRAFGAFKVIFPSNPMFSENNWFPGKTVTKSIIVENTDFVFHTLAVKAFNRLNLGIQNLSNKIFISITRNGTFFYGSNNLSGKKRLSDFYKEKEVMLPALKPGEKTSFDITLAMDETAGNEFQFQNTLFDLSIGFESNSISTINPIPTIAPVTPIPTVNAFPFFSIFKNRFSSLRR